MDDGEGSLGTNVVIERIISTRSGLHHFLQHETCLGPGILSLYGNPVFFFFALCTLKETLFLSRNPLLTQKCFPCSEFLDLFCSCPVTVLVLESCPCLKPESRPCLGPKILCLLREATKKVIFLVARPQMSYP